MRAGVTSGHRHGAVETPTGEMGDDSVQRPQQGRLAGAGTPDDQRQVTLLYGQVNVPEGRGRGTGVGDRHVRQGDDIGHDSLT